mmetsp:Transcript_1329/g.2608  ORF Transcript_1329/g.2608 Transcript_1329/m.2608 type:complete len:438 (-) Transcript_1329:58-1371(-)
MATASTTAAVPRDWPKEAENEFERIRVLGAGAFGEVFLAKRRHETETKNNHDNPSDDAHEEEFVAIKGVSIKTDKEGRTAAREIAILQEMNHPNIIRLLRNYEPASSTARGRYLALSFVQGKDVGELLEERGALAVALAQLIARHLISAVAYLHVRGVMHRDIKPDNIMVKGWADDFMWADEETIQEAVDSGKFSAILVDFGFARATRKEDYVATEREDIGTSNLSSIPAMNKNSIIGSSNSNISRGSRLQNSMRASRRVFRTMSAVGTEHFAAPEIMATIRRQSGSTACLTECVSSYALISDAYAVGATVSEMLTGVPPGEEVESYVKANRKEEKEEELIMKPTKSFCPCFSTDAVVQQPKPPLTTDICLRYTHELPNAAHDLVVKMMQENAEKRLSVRDAQEHEWVGGYDSLPHGDYPAHTNDPIVFVKNEAAFV